MTALWASLWLLAHAQEIEVQVLTPFRLETLTVQSDGMKAGGAAFKGEVMLGVSGPLIVCRVGGREMRAAEVFAHGPAVAVEVPGAGLRRYRGALRVRVRDGRLHAVVRMDVEDAVRSVVAAEMPDEGATEALRAQAIVTRSFLHGAKRRHGDADFCDTTHCQWLKEWPGDRHPAAVAARETRGAVLSYEGRVVAAMFFRACGGRTRAAAEVGFSAGMYPYFGVECARCNRDPVRWSVEVPAGEGEWLVGSATSEARRLELQRRGYAVRSNDYVAERRGASIAVRGVGHGHGVGLCQRGASAMARAGFDAGAILRHYFPGTVIGR